MCSFCPFSRAPPGWKRNLNLNWKRNQKHGRRERMRKALPSPLGNIGKKEFKSFKSFRFSIWPERMKIWKVKFEWEFIFLLCKLMLSYLWILDFFSSFCNSIFFLDKEKNSNQDFHLRRNSKSFFPSSKRKKASMQRKHF